jgi:ATP-binding cassette subfamily C (CFTR/MRP) protein 1
MLTKCSTSTQMVLPDVSLDIAPGEKVAICGSSGSGKSTVVMALLQLISLRNGQMTIDGIDLSKVEIETVRNAINVISQDPVSFAGTLRFNLDPRGEASDSSIISGLEQVGLWDRFALSGGLDTEVDESRLSVGELQLITLARALIRKRKIVVLDEAFSR